MKTHTSIRMPAPLREALEKLAKQEGRALSNLIINILNKYLGEKKNG